MKKILNKPETTVIEALSGMVAAHPELELLAKYRVVKKRRIDANKVSLISGGGSGHEPAHAGFVGRGMLDAAVCGDVFASPSQMQVYNAIKATASDKGTLLIIKNYSGDLMNFGNAAQLAIEDGLTVDFVKTDDDIAVEDSLYTVGRRGVAGTVFVHKVAGAAAERGWPLQEVKRVAEKANASTRSIGFAFSSCTVPSKGTPTFSLGEKEMEYGVGIHGEPGIRREPVCVADELAKKAAASLCGELALRAGGEVALMVNGFGATPLMELYLLNNSVTRELVAGGIVVSRTFVGDYMTSIDMAGASVTLLKLDDELKSLLSDVSDAPGFPVREPCDNVPYHDYSAASEESRSVDFGMTTDPGHAVIRGEMVNLGNVVFMVDCLGTAIIENEVPFCELDSVAGDGDFGMSLAKGFKQLKREWKEIVDGHAATIGAFLDACSLVIMEYCGGASGPIWGSAFRFAGKSAGEKTALSAAEFADMMQAAVKGVQATGERSFGRGAVVGDKTLIDALAPCADKWAECAGKGVGFKEAFTLGAAAAVKGAKATEKIVARFGRAGTVGERSLGHPDAGAHAVGLLFTMVSDSLRTSPAEMRLGEGGNR